MSEHDYYRRLYGYWIQYVPHYVNQMRLSEACHDLRRLIEQDFGSIL